MIDTYSLIILFSLAVILSFIFNLIAKRTHIPSVLMLIVTGIILQPLMKVAGLEYLDLYPVLEFLGVIGIIFIVLEAALELELTRGKTGMIFRSLLIAAVSLVSISFILAGIFSYFFQTNLHNALLYAVPLATISSAIVLPSVNRMLECNKEFLIYESTFSDILGIMFFFLLLEIKGNLSFSVIATFIGVNILLTIIISIGLSIFLAYIFQKIQAKVKLLLLISILILLYALGKIFHISSLLLILFFGLFLQNYKLLKVPYVIKFFKTEIMDELLEDLQIITFEISFVVRTFFFLVFGLTVVMSGIFDMQIILVSSLTLGTLYLIRWVVLYLFSKSNLKSALWVAPRGLITILLFFSIPEKYHLSTFNQDILLYVILVTGVVMAVTLIRQGIDKNKVDDDTILTGKDIC